MNKGLEVIEAHWLFDVDYNDIDVVVQPTSVIHSMVEFVDGSVLAQLGVPSMELPVLYALTHPDRVADSGVPPFDPVALSPLTFEPVRHDQFPAFALGVEAGRAGGSAPAVFNAANEAAVALFLEGSIRFGDIAAAIAGALESLGGLPGDTPDALLAADAAARRHVQQRFAC
jgi:1-deoxy-D-xylulose-5-phosphate reductoisomerase